MLTIFTTPKPFHDHISVIQRNAIRSWTHLTTGNHIILFGDEDGTAKVASEFDLLHVPSIAKNQYGTPLISAMFKEAERLAAGDIMCYVNADIILMDDLIPAVEQIARSMKNFLIVGQRWDLNITSLLDFSSDWAVVLRECAKHQGCIHGYTGIDFFVFRRSSFQDLPPFAVGRPYWDNYLIYTAMTKHIPVVDITSACMVIHQNHNYAHRLRGTQSPIHDPEAEQSWKLAGNGIYLLDIRDANHVLDRNKVLKPSNITAHLQRKLFTFPLLYLHWGLPIQILRWILRLIRRITGVY